jgi:DNA-binding beta-propeller fold protein YncE
LLKITGKSVSKVSEIPVGGLAEGIAFSPDGGFLYVGNFIEGNIDILRLDGDRLAKVSSFALQGHPAFDAREYTVAEVFIGAKVATFGQEIAVYAAPIGL